MARVAPLRRATLIALVAGLWPAAALAIDFRIHNEPLRLDLTESMYIAAHLDDGTPDPTDKNYGELINRLNAQLAWRRFLFQVRFDSAVYAHTPQVGDHSSYVSPPGTLPPILNCRNPTTPVEMQECVASTSNLANRFQSFRDGVWRGRTYNPDGTVKGSGTPLGWGAFYLEKISLAYVGRSVEVTLGDFYVNIGRGLVLSIRKIDELGVDTTISGGKLVVHQGNFSALAMAGFSNIQNIDQSRAQWTDDPNDLITAAEFGYRLWDRALLAGHVVWGKPTKDTANPPCPTGRTCDGRPFDYYLRPGIMIDAPKLTKWLGLYAEYARQQDRLGGKQGGACVDILGTNKCVGNALYGAVSLYSQRASWLLEFKYYDNYQPWHSSQDPFGNFVYMQPPTLEQVITQINNNSDIVAGRLRLDVRVNPAVNLFASAQYGKSHPSTAITDELYDVYGGVEARWDQGRSHVFPTLGYRHERDVTDHTVEERLTSVTWDAAVALPRRLSVETAGLIWFRHKNLSLDPTSPDNDWRKGNVYLSLKWSPKLVLSGGYEFTTVSTEQAHQHNFFNGSILWNITSATSISLFGGGNRPGLKCVSGVCRDFPAFQGVRLELVLRL